MEIVIDRINHQYGAMTVLEDINLTVRQGEILALLGPNGAGKTTLISIICGLVRPTGGTVRVGGHDIRSDWRAARKLIGLVPQEIALEPFEKVIDCVRFTRGLYGEGPDEPYLESLLRSLALWDKRDARTRELSGGMKRRVLIAKALSHRPKVLFLDEPTAGVDVTLRREMWQVVRDLRAQGVTIILTTHYLEEAEALSDRVVVLDRGKLVAEGSVREIRAHVSQRRVRCITAIDADVAARWPGVREAVRDGEYLRIVAEAAEPVVRRLFDADPGLHELEVQRAGLADAFLELTRTTDDSTVEQKEAA